MKEEKNWMEGFFEYLKENNPTGLVSRSDLEIQTSGLLKRKHMANLNSQGAGIKVKIRAGRQIYYTISSVIDFLIDEYLEVV